MPTKEIINTIDRLTKDFLTYARTTELSPDEDAFLREAWETLSNLREVLIET